MLRNDLLNLAVPLSGIGEAGALYDAGAAQFYCGVQTAEWEALYGNHDSISRRQGTANFSSLDELETVVKETAKLKAPLYLTVNGNYTDKQLSLVLSLVSSFEEMGGTGIMAADIALLNLLKKRGSKLVRGLSLMAAASSLSAVGFYVDLGVSRIVFPRFLKPEQISRITARFPEIDAECMVFLDKCRFIDGYCRFIHSNAYQPCDCCDNTDVLKKTVTSYDVNYRLPGCFELFGFPPNAPACGACGIGLLKKSGVSVFKMGGRGRPLDLRLAGVRFLLESTKTANSSDIKKLYSGFFNTACSDDGCYSNSFHI